jgi:hypothetical protein
MNNIVLFEKYNEYMEIMNDVKNHMSNYPYISFSEKNNVLSFNKDISLNYIKGILTPFIFNVKNKEPLVIEIVGKADDEMIINNKKVLGTNEPVTLYDFGIEVDAKIDTGADISSLHCSEINIKNDKVTFILLDDSYEQYTGKKYIMDIYDYVEVQSSNGAVSKRPIICTEISIKDETLIAYISLTDRTSMECGMLVGTDISSKFVVSPAKIK